MNLTEAKAAARKAAFARRKNLFETAKAEQAVYLSQILEDHSGTPLAGYMPIRTEIDPRPAMAEAAKHGLVGVPVIEAEGQPLRFAAWTPETEMVPGAFGAAIPARPQFFEPEVLILPMLAFSPAGGRLGYGGGFYDRTLEQLRARRPTCAIGFAFAGQEDAGIPLEPTDAALDMIVTEQGVIDVACAH